MCDYVGTAEEYAAALRRDTDQYWQELVDPQRWSSERGGSFSFLDATSFRYYLAPAMCQCLPDDSHDLSLRFALTLPDAEESDRVSYRLNQWSALTAVQRHCVANFVRFKAKREADSVRSFEPSVAEWQVALIRYWAQF